MEPETDPLDDYLARERAFWLEPGTPIEAVSIETRRQFVTSAGFRDLLLFARAQGLIVEVLRDAGLGHPHRAGSASGSLPPFQLLG
jgi:hypothetical protein